MRSWQLLPVSPARILPRVLRLGFLAPDILTAIANGRQPVGLTATKLLRDTRLPLPWSEQRKMLGFPAQL